MNILIAEMLRSLMELDMGFKGDLTMSDSMEALAQALFLDKVPAGWAKLAFPSMRALGAWLGDLTNRLNQLNEWSSSPAETPIVTWISGLFNPQSFLTAIMQITAQAGGLELDKLTLLTDVTKKMAAEGHLCVGGKHLLANLDLRASRCVGLVGSKAGSIK